MKVMKAKKDSRRSGIAELVTYCVIKLFACAGV